MRVERSVVIAEYMKLSVKEEWQEDGSVRYKLVAEDPINTMEVQITRPELFRLCQFFNTAT